MFLVAMCMNSRSYSLRRLRLPPVVRLRRYLSLSQSPSGCRLIENWAMLLFDVGFGQTDLWNGDRPAAVASWA